ncbi:unnamed protein product [Periconia digitata]|uniref:Uncharacterized protein n=1 Tax=Periconia digitata TaxID=1303443 RepID=A0A9W4UIQ7_9PLEO|nr:unnamed protein product [Periconia digitata]
MNRIARLIAILTDTMFRHYREQCVTTTLHTYSNTQSSLSASNSTTARRTRILSISEHKHRVSLAFQYSAYASPYTPNLPNAAAHNELDPHNLHDDIPDGILQGR